MCVERDPRITGECVRCGACCVLAEVFHYTGSWRTEEGQRLKSMEELTNLIPSHRDEDTYLIRHSPFHGTIMAHQPCTDYDPKNKSCLSQTKKKWLCSKWPLLKSDLEKVNCKGFKYS